jgi:hypothetical protein
MGDFNKDITLQSFVCPGCDEDTANTDLCDECRLRLREIKEKTDLAIIKLEPEAKEIIALVMKSQSTKDGYGRVMQILDGFPKGAQRLILAAMVRYGYPEDTAMQIGEIMGL